MLDKEKTITTRHFSLLIDGAKELGVNISKSQQDQLFKYLILLHKWNKTYNLTAVRQIDDMICRHLLDSLSIIKYVKNQGKYWLDVGSGGGLPGIPLAILLPEQHFTLLDSNNKKTRFLTQVSIELKLINVNIVQERIEQYSVDRLFDGICSRAFSATENFLNLTYHLSSKQTQWLAMKGIYTNEVSSAIPANFILKDMHLLNVPGCEGQRHLLILQRSV